MGWVSTYRARALSLLACRLDLGVLALATVVLLLTATACNSAPSAPDLPDVELPAIPRQAPGGSVATPVSPATPDNPLATSTTGPSTPDAVTEGAAILVPRLEIAETPADLPAYSRADWKHWNDVDKDCQDTRAEVLVEESVVPPTFKNEERCRVISGLWEGPYTGMSFTEASDVDIDHLVPLKNAHLSGGWQWDNDRRADYANSMATDYHLIAVEKYANRSKGARGPEEWQPSDSSYHCEYAYYWIAVKAHWGLTATPAEWASLEAMLSHCPRPVEMVDNVSPATISREVARLREELGLSGNDGGGSAVLTSTATPEPFSGSLVITEIMSDPSAVRDAAGEWFEVYNPGETLAVDLKGWTLRKEGGEGHRISAEVEIRPGGYLVLARNGDQALNGGIVAGYQYQGLNLTNGGDVIELVEPTGRVVDRVEYSEGLVFPGASTSLSPGSTDTEANDDAGNWCQASTQMSNGDFGTPGEANDECP